MSRLITLLALVLALAACGSPPRVPPPLAVGSPTAAATPPAAATPAAGDVIGSLPAGLPTDLLEQAVGVPFDLPLGGAIAVGDSGIEVRFTAVPEDSRCPEDARCIWAGRAVVSLEVTAPGVEAQAFSLAIPGDLTPDAPELHAIGPYALRLVELRPYPGATGSATGPYVATLVLERR